MYKIMKHLLVSCFLISQFAVCQCGNPGGNGGGSAGTNSPKSCDPNEVVGQLGFGDAETERFVTPGETLTYTINFENKSTATASAQKVVVDAKLSPYLDWSTFELVSVTFGKQTETGLADRRGGTLMVDRDGTSQKVQIEITSDAATGKVRWHLRSYDPYTADNWPADVYDGFLPPNDDLHSGEGSVTYRVKVREDAPHGARIDASAEIVFDDNPMIPTDPSWFNTVYAEAPQGEFTPSWPDGCYVLNPTSVSWGSIAGASSYEVTLWRVTDDGDELVAELTDLRMNSLNMSDCISPGDTTATYRWRIVARNGLGSISSDVFTFHLIGRDTVKYNIVPGWNLFALPLALELKFESEELLKMSPLVYDNINSMYMRMTSTVPGRTAFWLFSLDNKELQIWTEANTGAAPMLPPGLQPGWNLTGICGTDELLLDCEEKGVTSVWGWNGKAFEAVPIEDGMAVLKPLIGYWLKIEE